MFDFITLTLLWFFSAGISGILYLTGDWPGGIYWFWLWNGVTVIVIGFEIYIYSKFRMTLTRLIKQAETDKPGVVKYKWLAKVIIVSYVLSAVVLGIHLWPF